MVKMTVYHGSYVEVKHPRIIKGKYTKDFGTGFYCTLIKEQAERWASKFQTSKLNIYDARLNDDLKVLAFDEMNEEWLNFIIKCRSGEMHSYDDVVVGAMADDQVYNFIEDYYNGSFYYEYSKNILTTFLVGKMEAY